MSARTDAVAEPFHAWALTPPLGWNSWDSFGQAVTEDEVKANADFMAARLAQLGWRYVVVDIEWSEPQRLGPDYPVRSKSEIDAFGRFIPAVSRFPSSAGGRGFKPLADYVHGLGLKFGVHIVRASRAGRGEEHAIEGRATAADAPTRRIFATGTRTSGASTSSRAPNLVRRPLQPLAAWGSISPGRRPRTAAGYRHAAAAIDKTGRPIVLSLSYGPMPLSRADALVENANAWRLLGDLWDYWDQVLPAFRRLHDWTPYTGPGHWPEPDMLPLGHLRFLPEGWSKNVTRNPGYFDMASHGGREEVPNFLSRNEQRTIMTLWAISRSQMMFGGHLPASDAWTLSLITNAGILAVNQKSRNNRQLFHANGLAAWTADDPAGGAKYVAVSM
jgi:hypothetical protein